MSLTEKNLNLTTSIAPLGLISTSGAVELTNKVNYYLTKWHSNENVDNYIIDSMCPRFSSGDAKGLIKSTIRGKDLYILVDVGNYSVKYDYFGFKNSMSPDDHFQDLKRLIQAASGKAHRISVIMPSLYGGRQHRRSYRESLDCACALQELESMGVTNIICFDAHDPRMQNAVPLMGFDNVMPTYQVLKSIIKNIPDINFSKNKFMIVSPDEGALYRNIYYASVLGVDMGMFYKRRDYSTIINGRNPIVAHEYLGNSVKGKDIFIADDIISSGDSMLDLAYSLKEKQANRLFIFATYPIFTNGLDKFNDAYKNGIINGVFGTNLTYRTPELLNSPWFYDVDMSKYIAYIIEAINHDVSISQLLDPHDKIDALLKKHNIIN